MYGNNIIGLERFNYFYKLFSRIYVSNLMASKFLLFGEMYK